MARQQKISFFSQLRPTGVDPTAGANLRALAGLSEQVGDIAFQVGARKRAKEGAIAGAQAVERDNEGNIIPPKLESETFSIFGEAFNKAAILANKSQIAIDTREALDRLQNQHKLDPEAFRIASDGLKKGTLKGMPEELAVLVGRDIDSSVSNRHSKLLNDSFKRESASQRATALDSMESLQDELLTAVRDGDAERQKELLINANSELDAWVETGQITFEESRRIKEDTRERIQEQEALRDIDNIVFNENLSLDEQFEKGTSFVKSLRKKTLKDLSPEQKDSLIRIVEAKVNDIARQRASELRARDIAQEKVVSNLKIQANLVEEKAKNGEFEDLAPLIEETERLHNKGAISGNERTSIFTHIAKAQDEISRITLADKRILARLDGDNLIVMNKKDVDFFYKRNVQDDIETLPPEAQNMANANFIQLTRSIPSQVKEKLSSQVLSGDPEQIKQASGLIDRIDEIPGLADLAVDANQRAFIDNVVSLSQSMEPEQAVKIARELSDPRDKARIEAREELIKTEKLREDYPDKVENAFEGLFGGDFLVDNVNKQAVEAEYANLFEAFFKGGMSEDAADAKATEILQTNWRESDFGFMKHRPEDYYSIAGETDYIKDQLIKDLRKDFIGTKFKKDDVFLLSDDETSRKAAQGRPDYRVIVVDDNGQFVNFPGRWAPDPSIEQKRQEEENLTQLEKRRKRAIELSKIIPKRLEAL